MEKYINCAITLPAFWRLRSHYIGVIYMFWRCNRLIGERVVGVLLCVWTDAYQLSVKCIPIVNMLKCPFPGVNIPEPIVIMTCPMHLASSVVVHRNIYGKGVVGSMRELTVRPPFDYIVFVSTPWSLSVSGGNSVSRTSSLVRFIAGRWYTISVLTLTFIALWHGRVVTWYS